MASMDLLARRLRTTSLHVLRHQRTTSGMRSRWGHTSPDPLAHMTPERFPIWIGVQEPIRGETERLSCPLSPVAVNLVLGSVVIFLIHLQILNIYGSV